MSFAKNQSDKPEDRWIDGMCTRHVNSRRCFFVRGKSTFRFDWKSLHLTIAQRNRSSQVTKFPCNSMFRLVTVVKVLPVVPYEAVAEVSRIGNL